jgi:hypothetical protein
MGIPKRAVKLDTAGIKTAERAGVREGMHVCPECSSVLVQPVEWFEQTDRCWQVSLRCPECEWWSTERFSQPEVDRFDEDLDRGGQALVEDLRALTRANMEEESDRFLEALHGDLILPEDF